MFLQQQSGGFQLLFAHGFKLCVGCRHPQMMVLFSIKDNITALIRFRQSEAEIHVFNSTTSNIKNAVKVEMILMSEGVVTVNIFNEEK